MGVKHFYYWYSRQHKECIGKVRPFPVDILGIDMNGIFHGCAQKIYRYGNFADSVPISYPSIIKKNVVGHAMITPAIHKQYRLKLFQEVCQRVSDIVREIDPQKVLLLCVDGVAGLGKMNQQRQRRFRTSQDMQKKGVEDAPRRTPPFNPNQFTPGTALMDDLTRFLGGFIRNKQTTDDHWKRLTVVFSDEKAPGEGEHKIMNYIRKYADPSNTVCIYGMDADLVMLSMLLPTPNVLIARETDYYRHEYIVVSDFIEKVLQEMNWEMMNHPYSRDSGGDNNVQNPARFQRGRAIQDFVLLCFLVGNDFLPTIPALSIMDGGLHLMFQTYRRVGVQFGHLTNTVQNKVVFMKRSMGAFLSLLAESEQQIIEKKYNSGVIFYHDPIVVRHAKGEVGRLRVDLDAVRSDFYAAKFPQGTNIEHICHRYLDGMLWVANYYRSAIPDWLWHFPFLYGPYLKDLAASWKTYVPPVFQKNAPVDPFLQLIMVLPAVDQKDLVPRPLHFMDMPDLRQFYPDEIIIDLSGKKKEWEGIPNVPMIPYSAFHSLYMERKSALPAQDQRRNTRGHTYIYSFRGESKPYKFASDSFFIPQCQTVIDPIVLPN